MLGTTSTFLFAFMLTFLFLFVFVATSTGYFVSNNLIALQRSAEQIHGNTYEVEFALKLFSLLLFLL